MIKASLSIAALLASGALFAEVRTKDLPNNSFVQSLFTSSLRAAGSFDNEEREIKFLGQGGSFRGPNGREGSLTDIRYMSYNEAVDAASRLNAPALAVGDYGLNIGCAYVVVADFRKVFRKAKVFWCFESVSSGSRFEGRYWDDSEDWGDVAFTGVWDGTLKFVQ